jgi:hypothetical protein
MAKRKNVVEQAAEIAPPVEKKPRKPKAASQALPGLEKVRSVKLDRACEVISEIRAELSRARNEEAAETFSALATMRDEGVQAYTHANVELSRAVGEEKLRVRMLKDADEV